MNKSIIIDNKEYKLTILPPQGKPSKLENTQRAGWLEPFMGKRIPIDSGRKIWEEEGLSRKMDVISEEIREQPGALDAVDEEKNEEIDDNEF